MFSRKRSSFAVSLPVDLEIGILLILLLYFAQISKSEAKCGVMRLIVGGGRAAEHLEKKGAVIVGVRTLSEGGRVGSFSREQVKMQRLLV